MKTSAGQTQIQQKSAPERSKTAQKKKVSSDTLEFEDQRESSQAQADLQTRIDQSPRMIAQRKKIASVFGSSIQGQTHFPLKTQVESVSRVPVSDVKVHGKSSGPRELQAKPTRSYPIQGTFLDDLEKMDNSTIQSMLAIEGVDVSLEGLEVLRKERFPVFYNLKELKKHLIEQNQMGGNNESEEEDKSSKPTLGSKIKAKGAKVKNKFQSKLNLKPHDKIFKKRISESKYENYELKFHPPSMVDASLSAMQGATGLATAAFDLMPQKVKLKQFIIPSNERWARYVASTGVGATGGVPVVGIVSAPLGILVAEHAKGKGVLKSLGKALSAVPGATIDTALGIVTLGGYSVITIAASCVAAAKDILNTARSIYEMRDQCEAKLAENIDELESAYKIWKSADTDQAGLISGNSHIEKLYFDRLAFLKRQVKKTKGRRPDVQKWIDAGKKRLADANDSFEKVKDKASELKALLKKKTNNKGYEELPDEDPDISDDEEQESDDGSQLSAEQVLDLYDED